MNVQRLARRIALQCLPKTHRYLLARVRRYSLRSVRHKRIGQSLADYFIYELLGIKNLRVSNYRQAFFVADKLNKFVKFRIAHLVSNLRVAQHTAINSKCSV